MESVGELDSEEGVAQVLDESNSALNLVSPFVAHFLAFSLARSAMQEAVAWLKRLSGKDDTDALVLRDFSLRGDVIRVDLLSHLIRGNLVVHLELKEVEISNFGLAVLLDAATQSPVIRMLRLERNVGIDEIVLTALATLMKCSRSITHYRVRAHIEDDGIAMICHALADNNVLIGLNVSGNKFRLE